MKKLSYGLLLVAALVMVAGAAYAEGVKGEIVGVNTCKMCHQSEKSGNQFGIWEKTPHAKAFETLASDEAKKIAADKGLGDPQAAPECLKCHTVTGFLGADVKVAEVTKYTPAEGVSCEACHGAGSLYKGMSTMRDHAKAVAAGLSEPKGAEFCTQCHNENSPTFKSFDYEKAWAQIKHPVPKAAG
jgi:hypothetical protein